MNEGYSELRITNKSPSELSFHFPDLENQLDQAILNLTEIKECKEQNKSVSNFFGDEMAFSQALQIEKELLEDTHSNRAIFYNYVGSAYRSQRKYQKAIHYYSLSLEIIKTMFGGKHPDTAISFNNLGSVYESLGEYLKAIDYYSLSLEIRKAVFGDQHPETAVSFNSLGSAYQRLEEYQKAREYYSRALEIRKSVFGDKHPDIAISFNNLGSVYESLGEYLKAIDYYSLSLEIRKAVFGDQHPETAVSFNNLGSAYQRLGEYQKAREYYSQTDGVMKEKISEERHPRVQRFIEGETPKPYNNAFGGLDDYLSFFENRTPEMASFAKNFEKIETTQDFHILNQDIVPIVIKSIQTEALKRNKKGQRLIKLFQESFTHLEQFYSTILKAYCMETFLYKNLNQYLRNEDWTQLEDLLPYAFLLCKAFQCSGLTSTCNKYLQQYKDHQQHPPETFTLYRGAQFDEAILSYYNPEAISTFSWNAVTSTSKDLSVAEFFSEFWEVPDKIPVVFMIEVPISPKLTFIDIKSLSEIPEESEVVLPPGSIFELRSFTRDQKRAQIKLRLISDTSELALKGQIMHGAMHAQVSKGTIAKIICQEGKELMEALQHLKGNRMVETFECTLCKYDEKTVVLLAEVLPTLPKLSKIALASLSFDQDVHLKVMLKALGKSRITDIEVSDRFLGNANQMTLFMEDIREMKWLSSLKLDFLKSETVGDEHLKIIAHGGMNHLTSLTALTLNFKKCQKITDEGMEILGYEGLRPLTSLTTLSLDFEGCSSVTDKGIESLCLRGLRYLTSLTTLTLNFNQCHDITDEGMKILCSKELRHLTSLTTTLALDFGYCSEITDEGMKSLCEVLKHLTSLTTLTLDFSHSRITEEGIESLCEVLKHLTSLTYLTLDVQDCPEITGEGLNYLRAQCDTLNIPMVLCKTAFREDKMVFDLRRNLASEGLTNSKNQAVSQNHNLEYFNPLDLKCKASHFYTDYFEKEKLQLVEKIEMSSHVLQNRILADGMNKPYSERLRHMVSLTTLTIDVEGFLIANQELRDVFLEGFRCLTSLRNLTLKFKRNNITDEGMKSLSSGLRHLTSIMILSLDFGENWRITDEEIKSLCSEGLRYLNSLTTLTLNFKKCQKITDEGVKSLCLEGLRYLTSLITLTLDFEGCSSVTDKGIESLCLTSLTTLTLNFKKCQKITDEGVKSLCLEGLRYLTCLTTLTLNFNSCEAITDEGVKNLSSGGLRHLISLTTLDLSFQHCGQITGEGVRSLCFDGLRFLTFLTRLTLNFSGVPFSKTSYRGIEAFLRYFGFSSHVSLTI